MKAVVCREPFNLVLEQRAEPVALAGEAIVRIRRVGLCGTDYHIFAGRHPFLQYPRVMGHELAGEIQSASSGSSFAAGQRVAINPYLACGTCIACRNGKPNACVDIRVLGVHVDGGMSELMVFPESALMDAGDLTIDQAAMVEFLAIGAHAVARSSVNAGERVLVVGAGPIGVACGLFAHAAGATVTLIDTRPARVRYAQDALGFADAHVADSTLQSTLIRRTDGDMFDAVFDATGSLAAMANSLYLVAHGGRLVLVGVAPGDLVFADPELHKREATLVASRNALAADFELVREVIAARSIPIDALHTHSLEFQDLPRRMPELIDDADHVLKAIVNF